MMASIFFSYFRDTLRENIKISNIPRRLLLVVRFRDQYLQVPWPATGLHQLCPLPELRSGVMEFQGMYFIMYIIKIRNKIPIINHYYSNLSNKLILFEKFSHLHALIFTRSLKYVFCKKLLLYE